MKPLTDEQRTLVQAVLDGKTLQAQETGTDRWYDYDDQRAALQGVLFASRKVRIKPEPRKVTHWIAYRGGERIGGAWTTIAEAVSDCKGFASFVRIDCYPDEPDPAKRVTATLEDVK